MDERTRPSYRLAAPIKSAAQRFAYAGLVVSAFALMLLAKADAVLLERVRIHVTDAVAPIMDFVSRPAAAVSEIVDQARMLADLRTENLHLREERARLVQWQTAALRMQAENADLKRILNFKPGPGARFVSARVIADTGGAYAQSLILNAGTRDGVRKGPAVVTGEGLVGRIAGVGQRSARVLLITDLNSRIPVLLEASATRAILAGDNSDQPRLMHLPPGAVVTPGERVVTSGHGGVLPPRFPVGVVASVSDGGIKVQPYVRRDRLEYVRVVDFELGGALDSEVTPRDAAGALRAAP
ncbi:MAG: rod shape-determining protein MreC [Rhodospirillales bacterium]|nr:rod shape-determining protein MreC [Rhodospirillales bacterium]